MKKTLHAILSLALAFAIIACFAACNTAGDNDTTAANTQTDEFESIEAVGLWANATYLENAIVGTGTNTVDVVIEAEGQKLTLTIKTDKATLGEAMFELSLINDASFFDTLIGIKADWSADQAYWAFYDGESFMMVGINEAPVSSTAHYRLVYTR